jgi:hypothetical protein
MDRSGVFAVGRRAVNAGEFEVCDRQCIVGGGAEPNADTDGDANTGGIY